MSKKTLKDKVLFCLDTYPETRNSDITLTIMVWKKFNPEYIKHTPESDLGYLNLDNLKELPREDHIKRIRAKIQNEDGKYLPTSLSVAKQRRIEENKWREAMGYPPLEQTNKLI